MQLANLTSYHIKSTYLSRAFQEEIYVIQFESFEVKGRKL